MIKTGSALLLSIFLFSACEKIDRPYDLPLPGNVERAEITMGEDYETQVYFHFEDKKQYSENVNEWELAFETAASSFLIRMNGGKQVQVFNTGSTDFSQSFTVNGISWRWDSPDGNPDSVVFREWINPATLISSNLVFLVDRGPDTAPERYKKVQVLSVDDKEYKMVFANPDGSGLINYSVPKDSSFNYTRFSFQAGGKLITTAPAKEKYDILFTRYRYIYYEFIPPLPYSVNGVLINPYETSVAVDSVTSFENIDYNFAKTMTFRSDFDAIGFDWKAYNFTTAYYEVNSYKCYVLKDHKGVYYKFRFIDFYNSQGLKGSPEFEFQRL